MRLAGGGREESCDLWPMEEKQEVHYVAHRAGWVEDDADGGKNRGGRGYCTGGEATSTTTSTIDRRHRERELALGPARCSLRGKPLGRLWQGMEGCLCRCL